MTSGLDVSTQVPVLGTFDKPRFAHLALEYAPRWQTAEPFPHVVIDDFLDERMAQALEREFPLLQEIEWVVRNNQNNIRRFQHDETKLPRLIREMLRELNSRQFLLFVETLTGIDNLLPDPYFIGGGPHLAGRGDFLNIHADFTVHPHHRRWRRRIPDEYRADMARYVRSMKQTYGDVPGGGLQLNETNPRAATWEEDTPADGKDETMADDLDQLARRYRALAARLGELGYISPGSLVRRYTTCGKPGCRCQASPPQLHGPYYQLTRKVAGKTVTTRLTEGQAARYAEWIANQRELRRVLGDMEQISRQAAELILDKTPEPDKTPDQPA